MPSQWLFNGPLHPDVGHHASQTDSKQHLWIHCSVSMTLPSVTPPTTAYINIYSPSNNGFFFFLPSAWWRTVWAEALWINCSGSVVSVTGRPVVMKADLWNSATSANCRTGCATITWLIQMPSVCSMSSWRWVSPCCPPPLLFALLYPGSYNLGNMFFSISLHPCLWKHLPFHFIRP